MAKKGVKTICRGFFLNHRHLASHFTYITNAAPLNENIEQNLRKQLGKKYDIIDNFETSVFQDYMEKYLAEIHQTVEHKKQMQEFDLVCRLEFNGSTTMKDIHVLV